MVKESKLEIVYIQIDNLIPYAKNAKEHPQKQVDLLVENIKRFGFTTPLLIDEHNNVIAGHGRLLALQKLQATKAPCVRMEGLSEAEVKALRLADNKVAELGEWNLDLAIEELRELDAPLLDLTGFDKDLLIEPDEKDDEVPEVPEEPVSKLGDLYILGEHRVLCGDSTKMEDLERLMDGKKADMVFTDPPYGVNYSEKSKRNGHKGHAEINADESVESAAEVYGEAFKRIAENTKDGAVYYVCAPQGGDQEMMMMMMMRSTIPCRHQLIWKKDSAVFSMGRLDYDYQHEPILYGWKGSHNHVGNGRFKTSVWEIPRPKASKLHPTMKPVELIEEAILNSSKGEDVVIDLFLGSGSTLIAAEKTGRICYGMELDPKYVDVIVKRWEDYTDKKAQKI